jgi:hypothetical protein
MEDDIIVCSSALIKQSKWDNYWLIDLVLLNVAGGFKELESEKLKNIENKRKIDCAQVTISINDATEKDREGLGQVGRYIKQKKGTVQVSSGCFFLFLFLAPFTEI